MQRMTRCAKRRHRCSAVKQLTISSFSTNHPNRLEIRQAPVSEQAWGQLSGDYGMPHICLCASFAKGESDQPGIVASHPGKVDAGQTVPKPKLDYYALKKSLNLVRA
jgi:hypothetical protein